MTCGDCVDKLAKKLMAHHPELDMIRAYELAEKGVERHETQRDETQLKIKSGNPTDYTQPCTLNLSMPCPDARFSCTQNSECAEGTCPTGTCPAPLPNSHLETGCSSAGVITVSCAFCLLTPLPRRCRTAGTCLYNGTCAYECDADHVWNPVTLTCDPIPVAGGSQGGAAISFVAVMVAWLRRKRRKKIVAVILA